MLAHHLINCRVFCFKEKVNVLIFITIVDGVNLGVSTNPSHLTRCNQTQPPYLALIGFLSSIQHRVH